MHSRPRPSRLVARSVFVALPVILALALGTHSPVHAAWPTDPTTNVPLCTAIREQDHPSVIADGVGGAIVTWMDRRSINGDYDIYAQRISAGGAVQWTAGGVALCTEAGEQSTPTITSDGAGGAIVVWADFRGTSINDIYAQRISANGTVKWTANGVAICTADGNQSDPKIVPDGAGGAIITWWDQRASATPGDIYAQRISAAGEIQ